MPLPIKILGLLFVFIIAGHGSPALASGAHYNRNADGALPADLSPPYSGAAYAGSLEVYWLARLDTAGNESLTLDSAGAQAQGAPALVAAPDNCWGMHMNFGLIDLGQPARLTVEMSADAGASIIPGFALYSGWDTGATAARHDTITFGEDDPLGTTGLKFQGDKLGTKAGETIVRTFDLPAGHYELFVTVGNNNSNAGQYRLTLRTAALPKPRVTLTATPGAHGRITSDPPGLDCGTACAADFPSGEALTLTARPDAGHVFAGWKSPGVCVGAGTGPCVLTPVANTGIAAEFRPVRRLTVGVEPAGKGRVTSTPAGIDCTAACDGDFAEGQSVELHASPEPGYRFTGWTGACAGVSACVPDLSRDRTVGAGFAPQATQARVFYNRNADGALPADLSPPAEGFDYAGNLDLHWFAELASDNEVARVDSEAAIAYGAPELIAAPDNCWGHLMNFGLLRLKQAATLTITMAPDSGSSIIPGFALYQGWDTGRQADRHSTIYFGNNGVPPGLSGASADGRISGKPLGTVGLSFLGDILGAQAGEPVKQSFSLQPGNYELFVTVGNNHSTSGRYAITLETTPYGEGQPVQPVERPAECGPANNLRLAGIPPPASLCASGSASPVRTLRDGRHTWTCGGVGPGMRCYTLGRTRRLNQAPLVLMPGSQVATANSGIVQSVTGGSGGGAVRYRKIATSTGTRCKLVPRRTSVGIRLRGRPGTCQLTAIKGKSRQFNEVESMPITITVTP